MRKIIVSSAFLIAFGAAAQAAAPAPAKTVAGVSADRKYWLSEDLNRLVFWKAPDTTRIERPTH